MNPLEITKAAAVLKAAKETPNLGDVLGQTASDAGNAALDGLGALAWDDNYNMRRPAFDIIAALAGGIPGAAVGGLTGLAGDREGRRKRVLRNALIGGLATGVPFAAHAVGRSKGFEAGLKY